jgi:hypothetical protein
MLVMLCKVWQQLQPNDIPVEMRGCRYIFGP